VSRHRYRPDRGSGHTRDASTLRRRFATIGYLLIAGFVVLDASHLIKDLVIAKRAQAAEAAVLSVRQEDDCFYTPSAHCRTFYLPTVRFTTARGEHVEAETLDDSSDKSGVTLKVYYDPLNPHHVQANRWLNIDDMYSVLVVANGLLLGLIQAATRVKKRRSSKQNAERPDLMARSA
jgi:hypothetical protein